VIVLAIVAVVLGFALTGGSSSSTTSVPQRGSLVNALPGAAHVQSLLKGIPQHGNVLGSPTAPVTVVTYVDLQCPYCRQFELDAMPKLLADYVRTGKAKVELRPVAFIGPDSVSGRAAAIAAADQNKLFNFAQLLFLNQGTENTGWLDDNVITATAASIPGLDVPKLLAARNSSATAESASGFDAQADDDRVSGTPTILVGRTGGPLRTVTLTSPADGASVAAAIQSALNG
jgi:protein-disulfide isomerase